MVGTEPGKSSLYKVRQPIYNGDVVLTRGVFEVIEQVAVGIDGSPQSFDAFEQALELAQRLGSGLKCVFVVDSRKTQVPIVYTGGAYDISTERIYLPLDQNLRQHYAQIADDLKEFGRNCLSACVRRAADAGVGVSTIVREGYPTSELCEECKSADILVIGQQGENAHYTRTIVGSTTEDLVRTSPRPVVIVPGKRREIRRVLFVYDGSRASENALRFYVNAMGTIADDFVMMLVGEESHVGSFEEEVNFLGHHDVPVRVVSSIAQPSESVPAVAVQEDCDLILAGAYGRRKVLEFILGSIAAHLVRKSPIPVLIVH